MKKLIGYTLIVCGISLEVIYYFNRFNSETGIVWLSILQGVALTILLMGLFLRRDVKPVWLLIVPLLLYSIFNTSAGQRESLIAKAKGEKQEINTQKIIDQEAAIERKELRHDKITELMDVSISSFEDAYEWKNTTEKYETEQKALDVELESLRAELSLLRDPPVELDANFQLYQFYSEFLPIGADGLQFLLQLIFSFFIAIMAPIGITLIQDSVPKQRITLPTRKRTDWKNLVDKWVRANWINVRSKKDNSMLGHDFFYKWADRQEIDFPEKRYNKIKKAAIKAKVIDNDLIICNDESEAIGKILRILER